MKLSHTTLLALLATSTFVSAAPAINMQPETGTSMIKRSQAEDIKSLIEQLNNIKVKRSAGVDDLEIAELDKRAENVIVELISALASSGIIGDVWKTLTTDAAVKSEIVTIVKASLKGALVYGPSLLEALFHSGLFGEIFNTVLHDSTLQAAFLDAAKSAFSLVFDLISGGYSGSSGSSTTAAAAGATTTATSMATSAAAGYKRDEFASEYLSERDVASIVTTVAESIKNSGIVSSLVKKVLADPQQSISLLTTVFLKGLVLGEDVYRYAKSSGLLSKMISYLEKNGSGYVAALGSVLGKFVGDLSSSSTTSGTTTETTAVSVATTTAAAAAAAVTSGYSY